MPFTFTNPCKLYKKFKELKKEDVVHLQEWMVKQPHLPAINETEVIFFLHSCYYSIEKTKLTIENHFTSKTNAREIFGKINSEDFQKCMNQGMYVPLPNLTSEGYQILFCKVTCDPNDYIFYHHLKYLDTGMKIWFFEKEPSEGFVVIMDMKGYFFGHLTKIPFGSLKKLLGYCQEGLAIRLKAIHFINVVTFVDKILAIFKPFLKMEILNILHFHSKNEDLFKYVPQELLPRDYGGDEDFLEELHRANVKDINDKLDFCEMDERKWVDESKRQNKSKSSNLSFGAQGSFKKLELD